MIVYIAKTASSNSLAYFDRDSWPRHERRQVPYQHTRPACILFCASGKTNASNTDRPSPPRHELGTSNFEPGISGCPQTTKPPSHSATSELLQLLTPSPVRPENIVHALNGCASLPYSG